LQATPIAPTGVTNHDYQFAAGLNAALERVNELIATGLAERVRDDLATLQQLQEEFAAELASFCGAE